jgi:hypothetical protein
MNKFLFLNIINMKIVPMVNDFDRIKDLADESRKVYRRIRAPSPVRSAITDELEAPSHP